MFSKGNTTHGRSQHRPSDRLGQRQSALYLGHLKRIVKIWKDHDPPHVRRLVPGPSALLDALLFPPVMQPNNTPGKNASDIGLIIDAMDILYTGDVQGFCLVSSDGDFNKLATRLREAGKFVIGMGEKKTPESFRASCERFIFLDVIDAADSGSQRSAADPPGAAHRPRPLREEKEPRSLRPRLPIKLRPRRPRSRRNLKSTRILTAIPRRPSPTRPPSRRLL